MKDKIAREEALKALNDKNNLLAEQDAVREKVRPIAESYLFTLEFLNALSFLESSLLYIHLNDCLHVVEQLESTFVSSLAKQYSLLFLRNIISYDIRQNAVVQRIQNIWTMSGYNSSMCLTVIQTRQ